MKLMLIDQNMFYLGGDPQFSAIVINNYKEYDECQNMSTNLSTPTCWSIEDKCNI